MLNLASHPRRSASKPGHTPEISLTWYIKAYHCEVIEKKINPNWKKLFKPRGIDLEGKCTRFNLKWPKHFLGGAPDPLIAPCFRCSVIYVIYNLASYIYVQSTKTWPDHFKILSYRPVIYYYMS